MAQCPSLAHGEIGPNGVLVTSAMGRDIASVTLRRCLSTVGRIARSATPRRQIDVRGTVTAPSGALGATGAITAGAPRHAAKELCDESVT